MRVAQDAAINQVTQTGIWEEYVWETIITVWIGKKWTDFIITASLRRVHCSLYLQFTSHKTASIKLQVSFLGSQVQNV
jgi:hypothetical protein